MAKSQSWNSLDDIEKSWIASKATMNGSALSSEGNSVKLMDCGIDTARISTLGEYLSDKRIKEGKEINFDLRDDEKLAQRYVIPVILPNGQEIEVIVNKNGQDEACLYRDEEGNQREFQLTPRMRKAIEEDMSPANLKEILGGEEAYKACFFPDTLDDYADKVQKDELVPEDTRDAAKIAGLEVQDSREKEQEEQEIEQAEKEVPPEVRDQISKICSENNLDIRALKEVMEVEPEVITENVPNSGIRENDGRVTCLRFRDAANLQGRVVTVQASRVIDSSNDDEFMNDYMNEHRGQNIVKTIEDEHDKIAYTDVHGNTTICEITKEPRDITCSEKEILQAEMEKLAEMETQILNQDAKTPEEALYKVQQCQKINQKRLDTFKDFGVDVPLVVDEIEADRDILEKMEDNIEEDISEEKTTGIEGYEEHYGRAETGYGLEKNR